MIRDRFALSSSYRRAMHPAPRRPWRSVVLYRRFAAPGRSGYVSSPVFCLHLVTWRWANSAREGLKRLLNTAQCLVPGHILQQSATIRHDCGRTLFSRDMAIFNRTEMQGEDALLFSVCLLVCLFSCVSFYHHCVIFSTVIPFISFFYSSYQPLFFISFTPVFFIYVVHLLFHVLVFFLNCLFFLSFSVLSLSLLTQLSLNECAFIFCFLSDN